jgi:hypothetical protein
MTIRPEATIGLGIEPSQFQDQEAVRFLSGPNSVRDGNLVGLSIRTGDNEWESIVTLTFNVPRGTEGNLYALELSEAVEFEYDFTSENTLQQIAMVKCLWVDGHFYLSLDPWKESDAFISKRDNDCFRSKSAKLTVTQTNMGA